MLKGLGNGIDLTGALIVLIKILKGLNNWKLTEMRTTGSKKGKMGGEGWKVNTNFYLI